MISIPGYNLYSFALGCKHVQTFAVSGQAGVIADYILGELGPGRPMLPPGFYNTVAVGPGIEVAGAQGTRRISVTLDRLVISERNTKEGEAYDGAQAALARAAHLFPGILAYLNNPRIIFLGAVWEFVKASTQDRERFSHPAAMALTKRLIKVPLDLKEHASEFLCQISYRKQLEESYIHKGLEDYASVHLGFRDVPLKSLWVKEDQDEEAVDNVKIDEPRVTQLTVDIQRVLDPRRVFEENLLEKHYEYANQHLQDRVCTYLRSLGFSDAPEEK